MKLELPAGEFDGYIFDCDGTLADTMPIHYRAWIQAYKDFGTPFQFPEDEFYHLGGTPTRRIVEIFNERYRTAYHPDELADFKEGIFLKLLESVRPIQCVVDFAQQCKVQGKPIAVASGGQRHIVDHTLELMGLANFFPIIVTPENVQRGKPHPDMFLLAAEKMGVPPARCLVFEDAPTGIQAAQAAGMSYVVIPRQVA